VLTVRELTIQPNYIASASPAKPENPLIHKHLYG